MNRINRLDSLLKKQPFGDPTADSAAVSHYAEGIAIMEQAVVVVSDLRNDRCRIFSGAFAGVIGLDSDYRGEDSIWETQLLSLMTPGEIDEKICAELLFFNYLRRQPAARRPLFHLASKLRFTTPAGESINVLHRVYYIYDGDNVSHALCVYGPQTIDFPGRSIVVNAVTGAIEELSTASKDKPILSRRERQVLALIDRGNTTACIADQLFISPHTVSRHRQEILAKLQASNSLEACRRARSLGLI